MGYEIGSLRVAFRVSKHNSEQDVLDQEAVESLYNEIENLVDSNPEYNRIVYDVRRDV